MKAKRLYLVNFFVMMLMATFAAQAMQPCVEPQSSCLPRVESWILPRVQGNGVPVVSSMSDLTVVATMDECHVSHDASIQCHMYGDLSGMEVCDAQNVLVFYPGVIHTIQWDNDRERGRLIGYASMGSVPCFYHALYLEQQEAEAKAKAGEQKQLMSALINFYKHVLAFFILIKADIEFYKIRTGNNMDLVYEQIKSQFFASIPQRSFFATSLQHTSKKPDLFYSSLDAACTMLFREEMTHEFNDWIKYYVKTGDMRMIFRNPHADECTPNIISEADHDLYRGIIATIIGNLRIVYDSMHKFSGKKEEFVQQAYRDAIGSLTPPPQPIVVKA